MKITHSLLKCEVVEVKPYIFAVVVKNDYDRSMLFCRYQEYYESPYPEFYRKFFTLEEFMKIYSEKRNMSFFSYPIDWIGYNIPSDVLIESYNLFKNTGSFYDEIMGQIIDFCENKSKIENGVTNKWYILGVDKINSKVLKHEIAHGYYYTNLEYREKMDTHISKIKETDFLFFKDTLINIGYRDDKTIIYDEIQAYMVSYKLSSWNDSLYKKYKKNFIQTFSEQKLK